MDGCYVIYNAPGKRFHIVVTSKFPELLFARLEGQQSFRFYIRLILFANDTCNFVPAYEGKQIKCIKRVGG
jgi:hypothetical protein